MMKCKRLSNSVDIIRFYKRPALDMYKSKVLS